MEICQLDRSADFGILAFYVWTRVHILEQSPDTQVSGLFFCDDVLLKSLLSVLKILSVASFPIAYMKWSLQTRNLRQIGIVFHIPRDGFI